MPPVLFADLSRIDLTKVVYDRAAIEAINPHRYEMQQLDGIVLLDPADSLIIGYKDITEKEFWVRGHIPGRPLMPGVIMVEAAAQMSSIAAKKINNEERFIGFGGIEEAKFRGQVLPGCRLYMIGKFLENRPRRFKMAVQGVVNGELVFEAIIIGMPM